MADQEPHDERHEETRVADGYTPSQPYTIHGDTDAAVADPTRNNPHAGPDPLALVAGLVALALAALAMTGTLDAVDPRWVLAVGALLVGGTVLAISLRRRT